MTTPSSHEPQSASETIRRGESESGRVLAALGVVLVVIGLLCNWKVLGALFSRHGHFRPMSIRLTIALFDAALLGSGVVLIFGKDGRIRTALLRFVQKFPNFIAFCFGLCVCLILYISTEGTCYFINKKHKSQITITGAGPFFMTDAGVGYKPKANSEAHVQKKNGDSAIYDVLYSSDAFHRRKTPIDNVPARHRFILFMGCSFVFAEGLNDNQTIPYYFGKSSADCMPYNYGCSGYGTQQMLATLEKGNLRTEVEETSGFCVYVFLDDHIQRVIGSMYVHNLWGSVMPCYYLDHDELKRNGSFKTGRPWLSRVYDILDRSQIIKCFHISFPARINEQHIRLTSEIIKKSNMLFKEQFKDSEFYVLFYPGGANARRLKPYLDRAGIKYLDYTDLFDRSKPEYRILGDKNASVYANLIDEHPSAYANQVMAEKLAKDLGMWDGAHQ